MLSVVMLKKTLLLACAPVIGVTIKSEDYRASQVLYCPFLFIKITLHLFLISSYFSINYVIFNYIKIVIFIILD